MAWAVRYSRFPEIQECCPSSDPSWQDALRLAKVAGTPLLPPSSTTDDEHAAVRRLADPLAFRLREAIDHLYAVQTHDGTPDWNEVERALFGQWLARQADALMRRIGKKAAGRMLDGCIHNGFTRRVSRYDLTARAADSNCSCYLSPRVPRQ